MKLAWVIFLILFNVITFPQYVYAEKEEKKENSFFLKDRYSELKEDISDQKSLVEGLQTIVENLKQAQGKLENIKVIKNEDFLEKKNGLEKIISNIKKESGKSQGPQAINHHLRELSEEFRGVQNFGRRFAEQVDDLVYSIIDSGDRRQKFEKLYSNIERKVGRPIFNNLPIFLNKDLLPNLFRLLNLNPNAMPINMQKDIKEAEKEVVTLKFDQVIVFQKAIKDIYKKFFDGALDKVEFKLKTLEEDISVLENELKEVALKIDDEKEKESEVNRNLIISVNMMIIALVAMFFALKIIPPDVAKELVKRRTLTEVVGMAFMLITIIILGTAGRISTEILGTLLGTIAGYIFNRMNNDQNQSG
jgi:hypothetical protein